jgi:hypothetical protein
VIYNTLLYVTLCLNFKTNKYMKDFITDYIEEHGEDSLTPMIHSHLDFIESTTDPDKITYHVALLRELLFFNVTVPFFKEPTIS